MANWTRFNGISAATDGYATGAAGSEVVAINGSGAVLSQDSVMAVFGTASSAQTVYAIIPFNGNVVSAYCAADTASISATYTVKAGSAGNTIASVTQTSGVAGVVSTMTLGTVAVTAGQSISLARGVQGTTAASFVTVVVVRTS